MKDTLGIFILCHLHGHLYDDGTKRWPSDKDSCENALLTIVAISFKLKIFSEVSHALDDFQKTAQNQEPCSLYTYSLSEWHHKLFHLKISNSEFSRTMVATVANVICILDRVQPKVLLYNHCHNFLTCNTQISRHF